MSILDIGANYASAKLAWSRQKRMYKHRYQWQMDDMRKAGLNPILASVGGAPGGGSVQQQAPSRMGEDISSAIQARRQKTELAQIKSMKDLNILLGQKATEDIAVSTASARKINADALNSELLQPGLLNQANFEQNYPRRRELDYVLDKVSALLGGAAAGALAAKFFGKGKPNIKNTGRGGPGFPQGIGRTNFKPAPYVGPRN